MVERYYVLRISSYGSDNCKLCKDWEHSVNSVGGIHFSLADYKKSQTVDKEGRTNLFHHNCRCKLILSPDGIPIRDGLDKKLLLSGALGHVYFRDKSSEERLAMLRDHDDV